MYVILYLPQKVKLTACRNMYFIVLLQLLYNLSTALFFLFFFVHAPLSIVWCTGWTCVYYEVTSSDDGQDNLLNQDCDCEWCQSVAIRARSGEPPN